MQGTGNRREFPASFFGIRARARGDGERMEARSSRVGSSRRYWQAVAYVSHASPNADALGLQSLDAALSKTELVLVGTNGAGWNSDSPAGKSIRWVRTTKPTGYSHTTAHTTRP
jgi:hypothetical protein